MSINTEAEVSKQPEVDTYPAQPLEARIQNHSISPQMVPNKVDAIAPPSQSSTKLTRPASPESGAIVINAESSKSPILASTEPGPQTGRVLVPASSPAIGGAVANTKEKVQSQDATDDVESAVEPRGGDEESDPIEQESTQPPADLPAQSIDSLPRDPHRRTPRTSLNPPPVSEQPSRRSDRLANRRPSVATSEATLFSLTQVRRKTTSAFRKSTSSAKEDSGWIRDVAEEATRGKGVQKYVGKARSKSSRIITQHSSDSGDDTSPSVAREDGSPRVPVSSQVKWTTLPSSDQTQRDASSVIDELRTSSQGSLGKLTPGEDESSRPDEKKTPVPTPRGVIIPSRKGMNDVQPLFFPGSSQVPRAPSASPSGSDNESETASALLRRKTPNRSTPGREFRLLTVIASSDTLFSKSKAAQRRFKNTPHLKVQPQFDASDDEEDDEESSSSTDDAVSSSHIPKERRAGAARRKKGQGLSSLISR